MKIVYEPHTFRAESLALIDRANDIIAEYAQQGYDLTLRQLYYQLVARDIIPNNQRSYKNLGSLISDARRAGRVDWEAIVDRTRNVQERSHWDSPRQIIDAAIASYHRDRWAKQRFRPEVFIEKDALIGVILPTCHQYDVPAFACRGYVSDSELWAAGQRMRNHFIHGQIPIILHLGDHDPSGIDMTRDLRARLQLFSEMQVKVIRLALNMDQIEHYDPPPNPAKITDSRSDAYIAEYGDESWELDALEPSVITGLITDALKQLIEASRWQEVVDTEDAHVEAIKTATASIQF